MIDIRLDPPLLTPPQLNMATKSWWGLPMLFFEPKAGMYREMTGLKAVAEPVDTLLYQSLLPQIFALPAKPLVFVFIATYHKVCAWPGKILPWIMTRYSEACISLRCSFMGAEGWYPVTMPVTTWLSCYPGRKWLGFKKYIADEIKLEETQAGCKAWLRHEGKERLVMYFEHDGERELKDWEAAHLGGEAFFKDHSYNLLPAGQGPGVVKVWAEDKIPPNWSSEPGKVRMEVDPQAPWASLLSDTAMHAGVLSRFTGGFNLCYEMLA